MTAATAPASATGAADADSDGPEQSAHAEHSLRHDAASLRTHHNADGTLDAASSTDGGAMLLPPTGENRRQTFTTQMRRYGAAFGIDDHQSRAVITRTIPSATGGVTIRAAQTIEGVPVFGGDVVMTLDKENGVVAIDAATTTVPAALPAPEVAEAAAERNALTMVARAHRTTIASLTATSEGRQLYDPTLVGAPARGEARPVWVFDVAGGHDIRETVLVGTGRGEIVLHFDNLRRLNRAICDNAGAHAISSQGTVPVCSAPARVEGGDPVAITDVDNAYDRLGEVADSYTALDDIDLGDLVGYPTSTTSPKRLYATTRWCFSDACPLDNAFWDGRQIVLGDGYAAADDVIGHELTHGYVSKTSHLFPLYQSGAIDESVADVIGEIVDHRFGNDDDSAWTIGEDLPNDNVRSLRNPPLHGQPDRMTSPLYSSDDATYGDDAGGVHTNDGVGNKTAFLISQGGTFNGQAIAGIDGTSRGLPKTGRLYLEAIPRLTSGAQYADLGRTLVSTCDQLAASATGGFTSANCQSVRNAVAATELTKPPLNSAAHAVDVTPGCPNGGPVSVLARNDDAVDNTTPGLAVTSRGTLWSTDKNYVRSGKLALFGWDPDPAAFGDPTYSDLMTQSFVVPRGVSTYLRFDHAYLYEWYPATAAGPARYLDGGRVFIQTLDEDGTHWSVQTGLPWINGPDKTILGAAAWGGDSHGYGSSRVDLTALAGKTVRVTWRTVGDARTSFLGWWVDNMRAYTCELVPSAPRGLKVDAHLTTATVTWAPPATNASSVRYYQVGWSPDNLEQVPAAARRVTISGLPTARETRVTVQAFTNATAGPVVMTTINPTLTRLTTPAKKVRKNAPYTVKAQVVRRTGSRPLAGMPLTLQYLGRRANWKAIGHCRTNARGQCSWRMRRSTVTYYRVVATGFGSWLGSTSPERHVLIRER